MACGLDPQRDTDNDFQDNRDDIQNHRVPDNFSELLCNGDTVLPACSEVSLYNIAQPAEKAAHDVRIHMIRLIQLFQPFLVGRPAGRGTGSSPLPGHRFHKAGGHGAHDAVNDEGPQHYNDNGQKNPSYDKLPHVDVLPGP